LLTGKSFPSTPFYSRTRTPDPRSSEPAVENVLAQAVVQAFSTSGRLRVVTPEREGVEEQSEFWAGPPKGHDHHRVLEDG